MELFGKDLSNELAFIAEIGVNHEGSLDTALSLVRDAKNAGADAVKFQSYTPEFYISRADEERFERVSRFQLDEAAHAKLAAEAASVGIHFFSTAVSHDWVPYITEHCPVIKIASGDLDFEPVIRAAAASGRPMILSVGIGTIEEIDRAVGWVTDEMGADNVKDRLVLMHCVSAYPTPLEQANVSNVPFLRERYGITVGYSNHVIGPDACIAAIALGAPIVEVHFTDQKEGRTFRDHALSFEPEDLSNLIASAQRIKSSLGQPGQTRQPAEVENLVPARKGITAARDLKAGTTLSADDLAYARPAVGFPSTELQSVIGRKLTSDLSEGHSILRNHLA